MFSIEENSISFSLISKILRAFKDDCGIIGYNIKLIFLMISNEVYTIVFNLTLSPFFFHGS